MFPIKDMQTALGIKPALSQDMLDRIDIWNKAYRGKAAHVDNDRVISLRLESSSVRELANVTLSEMTTNVSNDKLNKLLNRVKVNLGKNLQRGLATGGMVIKPIDEKNVQFLAANAFVPLAYDADGRLCDVVFPEQKQLGGKYYTRLERHTLNGALTVTNMAFVSDTENALGREVPLAAVEDWKGFREAVTFPVDRNIFGYFRTPNDNTVDGSPAGISVFETALEKIKRADIQFGRLDYEFESAKRRIHADVSMVRRNDGGAFELDEVYVNVNGDSDDFYKEFSPALRQEGYIAGLEEYKREIEFDIGLSYGDLSQPQYVEKSATEVNASKFRKRNTVNRIQEQLRACLDDLVFALAFFNRLTKSGYEFTCDFKDSLLNDEQSEREEDRKDLANGTLRPEEYRSRWRNESLAEAKANLPEQAEVD